MVNKFYKDNFESMRKAGASATDSNSAVIYKDSSGKVISKEQWLKEADKQFEKKSN